MTDPSPKNVTEQGWRTPVTWGTIVGACYVVLALIGMGIAGTFFPETRFGGLFKDGPGSLLWWFVLLVPGLLIEQLWNFVARKLERRH